jgi:hypothetical protein
MARYLYSELASTVDAIKRLTKQADTREWINRHEATIETLVSNHLPFGSGFDSGTKLDFDASHAEKLVFETSFHHMNDGGYYDGWTEHVVTVTPSFSGFNIRISGRNRNDIKDYIHEVFSTALRVDVTYDLYLPIYPQFAVSSKWEDFQGNPSQCNQMWYVGTVSDRFTSYQFARERAAGLMVEASRIRS